jgi:hypothetical protein
MSQLAVGASASAASFFKEQIMKIADREIFIEGRGYWQQYVTLNGYAFRPTDKGLKTLSRNLDINVPHLRRCINQFLQA